MLPVSILIAASAVAVQPIGDPQSWITADDYPDWAIAAATEGVVQVALSIDSAGQPEGCQIRTTSGNSDLDALTCTLLRERARFSPAHDQSGQATGSEFVQRVHWAIPREKLITQGYRVTYSLDGNGHIDGCKIDEFGGHDPELTCSSQLIEDMAAASLSKPLSSYARIIFLFAVQRDDDAGISVLRPESGEQKILTRARINVSPDGVITGCVTDVAAQIDGPSPDLCRDLVAVGGKEFDNDPEGRERTLTVSFELIGDAR